MIAVMANGYGSPDVLEAKEIAKPSPKSNEVLIKVITSTVHRGDAKIRSLDAPNWQKPLMRLFMGMRKPKNALGMELSGIVTEIGKNVKKFKVGDEVFAMTLFSKFGGNAEYKTMAENNVIEKKPANLSHKQTVALSGGGITALWVMKRAKIKQGQKVLVYGASGSIGTFAVQIAKSFGAIVTGVCSTENIEMVKNLGADKVIDYTKENFTTEPYDIAFDAVSKMTKEQKTKLKYSVFLDIIKHSNGVNKSKARELLTEIKTLAESGKVKAVIDKAYPMEQIVDAHRYVDTGKKKGNVIIRVQNE
jgi:NADPH:quinone reductase-like Zn-dependent oxidoreductase